MKTILKGGVLVDGTGRDPVPDAVVVIEGDRIVLVGSRAETSVDESSAQVIDVTGKTILPGFFNCHAHLAWDGVHDLREQSLNDSPAIAAYKSAMNMRRSLEAGVTTVRDLGVKRNNIYAKEALQKGIVTGPRLLITGEAIAMTGGHTWWCCREVDGIDGMRQAVREQIKAGADLIKIMPDLTLPELEAGVDEAHRAGKRITAHATFDKEVDRVVKAGVDSVEHGGSMSDETIEMMVNRGVFLVTTFSPVFLQAEHGHEVGMSEAAIQRRRDQLNDRSSVEGIVKAARAGVKVALGTDAGSPAVPHNEIATELSLLVKFGVCRSTMEALMCATLRAAELTGLDDKLGTLEEGKLADIVVVGGDPLAGIEVVRDVDLVFKGGKLLVKEGRLL
jgi:imidazolonepropionase-like amidohydrolase